MPRNTQPKLDASQGAFCKSTANYIRLLAPAGCGKTLSIAHRCLHLIERDQSKKPRFLVVTFTRAARDELKSRLNSDPIFAPLRDCVDVVTLNQWGNRRLRQLDRNHHLLTDHNSFHFGMMHDLKPIWEKHTKVRDIVSANKGNSPRKLFELIDAFKAIGFNHVQDTNLAKFMSRVNTFREQGLTRTWVGLLKKLHEQGVLEKELDRPDTAYCPNLLKQIYGDFFRFWRESVFQLASMAKYTLEDQKYRTFITESELLENKIYVTGVASIQHLLVDEFQDINPLDLALLQCIAERNRSTITIVGDDDQAIYEWRGATPKYILEPESYFGHPFKTFVLSTNYRSPKNIVMHSQNLIAQNRVRVEKKVVAQKNTRATIEVVHCANVNEGIASVIDEYHRLSKSLSTNPRLAVIARKRAQILPIQIHLASKGIEFCAADDLQIFLSVAFDQLISLLEIKQSCREEKRASQVCEDVIRLCNLVKRYRVSKAETESLRQYIKLSKPTSLMEAAELLASYKGPLKGDNKQRKMSVDFSGRIRSFLMATTVSDALRILAEEFDGLQKDLGKAEDDVFFTDPPFAQLAQYAETFHSDYEEFIHAMERAKETLAKSPIQDTAEYDLMSSPELQRPIHLLTAQRAKGREFETVIVLDVNEGFWPCSHAKGDDAAMEEERRLFYVAITRPKNRLILTVQSDGSKQSPHPSRFLDEAMFRSQKMISVC